MKHLIKNTKTWVEYMVVAWWMHLVPHIKGKILVIGSFNNDAIDYLSEYCDEVYIDFNETYTNVNNTKVLKIDCMNNGTSKYDAIIIDAVKQTLEIKTDFISFLINNSLSDSGVLCFLENNDYAYRGNAKGWTLKIVNLLFDLRKNKLKSLRGKLNITKLPTIYYENEPYESFTEGMYFSNKNVFLLKEKFRMFVLRNRFSRLFVGSNVWLMSKNKSVNYFHESLLYFVSENQNLKHQHYTVASILYKRGKLIFTYKHKNIESESFIAIVTYEDVAYKQRVNEKKIIQYLSTINNIAELMPKDYYEYEFLGYMLFTMKECVGITVDAISADMNIMSNNICKTLIELAKKTYKHNDINKNLISGWLNILKTRSPKEIVEIKYIEEYISDFALNYSVCMHGDAKIENFVLDKNNSVVGVIDWEQAIIKGLPLIDLFYLITYNYQVNLKCDFYDAFSALIGNKLNPSDYEMIEMYSAYFDISIHNQKKLYVIFFVHHYSCRYHVNYNDEYDCASFKKSLKAIIDKIQEA